MQVFAANLSGSRLPGVIARHTSQSWQLDVAYGSSIALIGLSVWQPSQPGYGPWTQLRNWMSVSAMLVWVFSLIFALLIVFRRVDFSRAASSFVSLRRRRTRQAGRSVGRIQAESMELTSLIEASGAIEIGLDAVAGVWDKSISASDRGIFLPRRSELRQLLGTKPVREGLRLRITSRLGSTVNHYDIVAQALPLSEQSVDAQWLRTASRKLRPRSSSRIDDHISAALALLKLATDLAESGDTGTAQQVAQSLVEFVNLHMAHADRARSAANDRRRVREALRAADEDRRISGQRSAVKRTLRHCAVSEATPVDPTLRAVLQQVSRSAVDASGPSLDTIEYIVRAVIMPSPAEDLGAMVVASTLTMENIDSAQKATAAQRLLRICALHALEHRHRSSFQFVMDAVSRAGVTHAPSMAHRLVTELTAFACRYEPSLAIAGITVLDKLLVDGDGNNVNTSSVAGYFWIVGAASVSVGAQSVAVNVAEVVRRRGLTGWIMAASQVRSQLDSFVLRSDMFGGYLGDRPRDALATFGELLKRLETWREISTSSAIQ